MIKKLRSYCKKLKIILALLLIAGIGIFLFNSYQRAYKPYLYDKGNYYYKAYHYSVKKIKSQKKLSKILRLKSYTSEKAIFLMICLPIR